MRLADRLGLTGAEERFFRTLRTPAKIQDWLDALPINFERSGPTYRSPWRVLRVGEAHCLEGALCAALALWLQGEPPLLLDLHTADPDEDHVVTLFRRGRYWGALSKTNHAVLRYRDAVYRTPRELALSYFHEYFLNNSGRKTLLSYSRPFDLRSCGTGWPTAADDLDWLVEKLDRSRHYPFLPAAARRSLRPASRLERRAGELTDFAPPDQPRPML